MIMQMMETTTASQSTATTGNNNNNKKEMMNKSQRLYAIHLNNEGARYLEDSLFEQARDCFYESLSQYTASVEGAKTKIIQDASWGDQQTTFYWSSNPTTNKEQTTKSRKNPLHCDEDDDEHLQSAYVYRKSLFILGPDRDVTNHTTYSSESAAVVYNLGLTHHLMGIRENVSKYLSKALQFYTIAASIRRQQAGCPANLIDIAILNNMGHIHYEFVNYQAARDCFSQLCRGLKYFNRQGILDCTVSQVDQDGFVMNVMMTTPQLAAAA